MNTAAYVDEQIQILKGGGIPLADAAWQAALLCVGWPYIFGDRGQYCTPGQRRTVHNKHPDQEGLVTKCQVLRQDNPKPNCNGCKWFPNCERVRSYDCRGFTYWVIMQIYGFELKGAGATSQWNTESNWKAKGLVSDGVPEDLLVCLFYPDKKNQKVMAHTGLGFRGETCECSNGVQHFASRNRKWTHWAVPACVEGDVPPPDPDRKPTLRKGDSGTYVTLAQTMLIQRGYDLGSWGADGKFGSATEKAVKQFQTDWDLKAVGVINQETWKFLESTPVKVTYTVTIRGMSLADAEAVREIYPKAIIQKEVEGDA